MAVSKRVQVLLRDRVHEIVHAIAEDENLSMSRVCSLLVEEALITRGAFSKTSHIRDVLPSDPARDSLMRKDSLLAHAAQQGIEVHVDQVNTRKPETDISADDLKLLKKLKMLKELELL